MKITKALRAHLVSAFKMAETASDDDARKLVSEKLASGELTPEQFATLSKEASAADKVGEMIDERIAKANAPLAASLAKMADAVTALAKGKQADDEEDPEEDVEEEDDKSVEGRLKRLEAGLAAGAIGAKGITPQDILLASGPQMRVDVKRVTDMYSNTKSPLMLAKGAIGKHSEHFFSGQQAHWQGRPLEQLSQLEKACVGAWLKVKSHSVAGRGVRLTDHDALLYKYLVHECPWSGPLYGIAEVDERKLTGYEQKALLDDSTSGGQEIVPYYFDQLVMQVPLLHSEVYPMVQERMMDRGSEVQSATLGRAVVTSGPAEGTAATPMTTTGFVSDLSADVFECTGYFEIGRNFMEDTPVAIAENVTMTLGDAAKEWLDIQIMLGDGTTEPLGILVASGTISVNSANGIGGPFTIGDTEVLEHGLTKAFRSYGPGGRLAFVGNDTSWRRLKGIPVGANDQRRIITGKYQVNDYPYKVVTSMADNQLVFANLWAYLLWRRRGMEFFMETAGRTLALSNLALIGCRMRFAGKPGLGGAFSIMSDAPIMNS